MNTLRADILKYAAEQYGTEPDYPWGRYAEYAVLRHGANKKWYALIMNIKRDKLGLPDDAPIDVMNVKIDPELGGSIRMLPGVYPAYHMNHKSWVSVALDGSADYNDVIDLLDTSYKITAPKSRKRKKAIDSEKK